MQLSRVSVVRSQNEIVSEDGEVFAPGTPVYKIDGHIVGTIVTQKLEVIAYQPIRPHSYFLDAHGASQEFETYKRAAPPIYSVNGAEVTKEAFRAAVEKVIAEMNKNANPDRTL